jgi:hypothetical protein
MPESCQGADLLMSTPMSLTAAMNTVKSEMAIRYIERLIGNSPNR